MRGKKDIHAVKGIEMLHIRKMNTDIILIRRRPVNRIHKPE
jgi:hypothetical protein